MLNTGWTKRQLLIRRGIKVTSSPHIEEAIFLLHGLVRST